MTKLHVLNASGGNFKNDNGENIPWANAHILKDEKENNEQFTGQVVSKVKASMEFFRAVQGKLPALLDVDFDITNKGEVKLIGIAKPS